MTDLAPPSLAVTLPAPTGPVPSPAASLQSWIVGEGMAIDDPNLFMARLADLLLEAGLPLDRMTTAIDSLHSEYSGVGRFWLRGEGVTEQFWPYGDKADEIYAGSVFARVHKTREWLRLKIAETPDDAFNIIPDLKAAGYTDYVVAPIFFSNGDANGLTLATRSVDGFSDEHVALLRAVMPALSAHLEVKALRKRMDHLLRFYVGDEPAAQIFSGVIRRGQVNRIRSAILVADMRRYTTVSHQMPPEKVAQLLNAFFDCLVPPIDEEGGEVLKFMGDGLLAIFRDRSDDTGSAARAALDAAERGIAAVEALDQSGAFELPIHAGIALHHGEAAYGNVGSGTRLDFTVVGRDVNIASRIATLNRPLGEPLLMSKAFAEQLWIDVDFVGKHQLEGVPEPVPIYRPKQMLPPPAMEREPARVVT